MINIDVVGKSFTSRPFRYDQDSIILYALGIGADTKHLDFIYEKNLKVYPSFSVVPLLPALMAFISAANIHFPSLLHGEQSIEIIHPIPLKSEIIVEVTCDSIFDKGDKGAVFNLSSEGRIRETNTLLFRLNSVLMDRKSGNFGGERGPRAVRSPAPIDRSPDFCLSYHTSKSQAALYRLSGDKNPLHIDPKHAKLAGFDTPILHGLCTLGIATRSVIHTICEGEPEKLEFISVRFKDVVFPGDTLITEGWKINKNVYFLQAKTNTDKVVLADGEVRLR